MTLRVRNPHWGRAAAFAAAFVCATGLPAAAQPKKKPAPAPLEQKADKTPKPAEAPASNAKKGPIKEQNFNFDGLGLNGRSRSPQLLYFLERANEELERASLEKRSFIPSMVKTVEEEQL
jgi:hypothetical protein